MNIVDKARALLLLPLALVGALAAGGCENPVEGDDEPEIAGLVIEDLQGKMIVETRAQTIPVNGLSLGTGETRTVRAKFWLADGRFLVPDDQEFRLVASVSGGAELLTATVAERDRIVLTGAAEGVAELRVGLFHVGEEHTEYSIRIPVRVLP